MKYFDKYARLLLATGVIIGVVLLAVRAVNYPQLKHDEVISYLAATGHKQLYQNEGPADQWVPASMWQAYWKLDGVGIFSKITKGLNLTDIHPPLYFWILNLWSGIFGINTATGALLNIPFHILITLMIFFTCRLLKYPLFISAAAAVLWMVRYSIIEAGVITRQYSLLGLVVICFAFSAINFKNKPSIANSFWLGLCTLVGVLTHYQFVILVAIAFAWLAVFFYLKKDLAPIYKILISSIAAALLFLLINPGFFQSVMRQQQRQAISLFHSGMPYLAYRSFYDFSLLFLPEIITVSKYSKINMVIFAVFLLGVGLYIFIKRKPKNLITHLFDERNFITVTSFLTLAAVVLLYVIRVFPKHAMSVKSLMLVSPLLFVVLAQLLLFFDKNHHRFIYFFTFFVLTVQIIFGIQGTIKYVGEVKKHALPEIFKAPVPIILDQTTGGILPANLWYAHPDSPVYAASQDVLINDLPDLRDYSTLYLIACNDDYYNDPEKRPLVLGSFADHGYTIKELGNSIFIEGKIYELTKATG